ncbi:hypothetical protein FJW08_12970 [Mesorhizobium sp. B3-2-1]|uniref:helix-turn-helix transcriptional regulator n=1 Tax=Mesorhizobium sp. B3-2-1 TaxID=2589891 RepID=UPI00112AF6E4|nr:helix-turn-helix transcriptional regulator [Mesorhizobium sp. B3-2-1]TPI31022.1 hypothetical protein FJW08_12970 [Mesorhizobium sp. B3-2-1]
MKQADLKTILSDLELSQADFARLIDVTPRAISLWLAGERAIPGPVESYLRLFKFLPGNLRQQELLRLKAKGTNMRDGMYGISFQYGNSAGMGALVFEGGRIYGADSGGVKYDGEYEFHEETGLADVKLKVSFPPNVPSVFGVQNPYEWSIDITSTFNPNITSGNMAVKTSIGRSLQAQYVYLRQLPEAA